MSALSTLQAAANALSETGSTASTSYEAAALLDRAAIAASGSSTVTVRRDSCESFAGGLAARPFGLHGLRSKFEGSDVRSLGANRVLRGEGKEAGGERGGCRVGRRGAERDGLRPDPPPAASGRPAPRARRPRSRRDARELGNPRSVGALLKRHASIAQAVVQQRALELRVRLERRVARAEVMKRALAPAVQLLGVAGHGRLADQSAARRPGRSGGRRRYVPRGAGRPSRARARARAAAASRREGRRGAVGRRGGGRGARRRDGLSVGSRRRRLICAPAWARPTADRARSSSRTSRPRAVTLDRRRVERARVRTPDPCAPTAGSQGLRRPSPARPNALRAACPFDGLRSPLSAIESLPGV